MILVFLFFHIPEIFLKNLHAIFYAIYTLFLSWREEVAICCIVLHGNYIEYFWYSCYLIINWYFVRFDLNMWYLNGVNGYWPINSLNRSLCLHKHCKRYQTNSGSYLGYRYCSSCTFVHQLTFVNHVDLILLLSRRIL